MVIFLSSSIGFAQDERYIFSSDTIDKLIVDAERCIITNKNLSQCEIIVKNLQEQLAEREKSLNSCEGNFVKKDELYSELSKIKDTRLKTCEEQLAEREKIYKAQQEQLENVSKLIQEAENKAWWKSIWYRIEWSAIGAVFGILVAVIFL